MTHSPDTNPPSVPAPLELCGGCLERYFEIRMLRLLFDSSGARSVHWDEKTGEAMPGILYPSGTVYAYPPPEQELG